MKIFSVCNHPDSLLLVGGRGGRTVINGAYDVKLSKDGKTATIPRSGYKAYYVCDVPDKLWKGDYNETIGKMERKVKRILKGAKP